MSHYQIDVFCVNRGEDNFKILIANVGAYPMIGVFLSMYTVIVLLGSRSQQLSSYRMEIKEMF